MHRTHFFTVGGTVQAAGGKYIHRRVDDELLQLCRKGTFGFVLTARQMGKSSLMVRTAERLGKEGIRSVVIDLSQLGVQVAADAWYLGLLTRIEDALDLDTDAFDWWEDHKHLGLTQRLTQFFQHILQTEVDSHVVIFIDEIDSTLSLPFTDDFFAAIRYVYNARSQTPAFNRLTFVLIGVASPNDLISDAQRTPFNIGSQVNVEYFTLDEAMPLAEGFELPPDKSREVLGWILSWTGGHPYLTQRLCATAASRGKQNLTRSELDQIVRETFFGQKSEEDSNLRFVQDMVVRRAPDTQAALTTYERIVKGRKVTDDKASQTIAHLKLSGIVARENGSLAVRNRIYAVVFGPEWVRDQFPEHWIKRVPPAVMGLVAASFVAVIALGLLFFQSQQASQAREQSEIQATLNSQLSDQIAVSDSLLVETEQANMRLAEQFSVTDSLRLEQEAANDQLVDQIRLSNRLRAESEELRLEAVAANNRLAQQVEVSDSLREVAESLLDAARIERIETITIALSSHAQRQLRLGDPELGALLARQAYLFSEQGQGRFIAPVHDALRESLNELGLQPALANIQNATAVRSVAFSPSGSLLAWGGEGGSLGIAKTGSSGSSIETLTGHRGGTRAVIFSPKQDQGLIVSGGEDGSLLMWNSPGDPNDTPVKLGQRTSAIWTMAFSANGSRLAAAGADSTIEVWNLTDLTLQRTFSIGKAVRIRAVAFNPVDNSLVAGTEDGLIHVVGDDAHESWNAGQGRLLSVAVNVEGDLLATGGTTGVIKLWSIGRERHTDPGRRPLEYELLTVLQGHEGPVNALAFSPDGKKLASGSSDHSVQVWDIARPDQSPILLQGHDSWVWSIAFRPDGEVLASAGADKRVATWFVDLGMMADRICEATNRDLTREEWMRFVGLDVRYEENYEPCLTTAGVTR